MAAPNNVKSRKSELQTRGRERTGWLLAALLSMACAEGCSSIAEDGNGRRANARIAIVESVPPQKGQAFFVGVLVSASAEDQQSVRLALQQAAQANHLELDAQTMDTGATSSAPLLERWQSRQADALLIYASGSSDLKFLLVEAGRRQIPVVVAQWEEAILPVLPTRPAPAAAVPVGTAKTPEPSVTAQNIASLASTAPGKRAAVLTLFHNSKSTRKTLSATPQELGQAAVATIGGYLRGEKVKPVRKSFGH